MPESLASRIWTAAYATISASPRAPRRPIPIPDQNTDRPREPADVIEAQKDYVQITVSQLFLAESRRWFTEIEPAVFASTEFLYDGQDRTDPFMVGPKQDGTMPRGMVLKNTSIFGPHPYRGGALTYTIVLSRLPVGNVARRLLDVIEAASTALDPTATLSKYLKAGNVVLNGFEKLLGLDGVAPLIGVRQTINPDRGDRFRPGYVAMIDAPDPDPARLFVRDDELLSGASLDSALPYRDTDFVLFQVTRVPDRRRKDVDRLPFYPLWRAALESAGKPNGGAWDEAKAHAAVLASAINLSPDLLWDQGQDLIESYVAQLKQARAKTLALSNLAPPPDDGLQTVHEQVRQILELA